MLPAGTTIVYSTDAETRVWLAGLVAVRQPVEVAHGRMRTHSGGNGVKVAMNRPGIVAVLE
ncbi:hypothetical protein V6U89_18335 [Micromonospora sp. CPCC 206171]|uniref:hypothetical protein n=1 Tax=Micromonospora sp. CPCC 206171 TaxID=3122405 RepID=UPI002FF0C1B1